MSLESGVVIANRFTVDKRTAAGGMGVVYRAVDQESGKPVALKILSSDDPDEIARFEREAALLSVLAHPGIVTAVASGKIDSGESFLAMEWLEGCDLAERLKRGHLSIDESISLLRGTALALATAHASGIVHRDVKPGNLFLRNGSINNVVLLDFGIARHAINDANLTLAGSAIGTPYYMAPEQAMGQSDIGPAADIFSLGCVLFECLTGKPPFHGMHVLAVLSKIIFEDPPSLERRMPGVDRGLSSLCARMLAKDPKHRIGNASALLMVIDELGPITTTVAVLPTTDDTRYFDTQPPTLAHAAELTTDEQEVVCVITMQQVTGKLEIAAEVDSATSSLAALGLRVEQLADGTLVSTLSRLGQATDQVARAARAALLLNERFPGARVALATGRARAGRRQGFFVGDAIDRVFRMLDRTRPNDGVFIDELTAGLLDERFIVETRPQEMSVLRGERIVTDESKRLLGRPTPCVGRLRELNSLQSAWSASVSQPEAHAVVVTAPPGVGKSRLRHEFLQRLEQANTDCTIILGRGDPIASASLGILSRAIRTLFGVDGHEDVATQRTKVDRFVRACVSPPEATRIVEFIGELVGIPFPGEKSIRLRLARQEPRIMMEQMTFAFVDLVRSLSHLRPVLIVLEDLHWSDAFSVALAGAVLNELKELPILVLAFARPEVHQTFPRLWGNQAEVISLAPLRSRASEQLARGVLGDDVDPQVLQRIVELSGGNALFLEELIRAVADGRGNELPETVLAILQARIGRFEPEVRRILRAASIWGLTCTESGVRALVGVEANLSQCLTLLVENEILERRPGADSSVDELVWRHALVRDAAYAMLVDEDRVLGHCLAGEWLESRGNADSATMAEHFYQGQAPTRALPHCVRAAELMYDRSDFDAALRFTNLGIDNGADGLHLGILFTLRATMSWYRIGAQEWMADVEAAVEIFPVGHPWWFRAVSLMCGMDLISGNIERAVIAARRLSSTIPPRDAGIHYVVSCWSVGAMLCQVGQRAEAAEMLKSVWATINDQFADIPLVHAWGKSMQMEYTRHTQPDPWVHCRTVEEIVEICENSGVAQRLEIAVLRNTLAFAYGELGEHARCEALLRKSIDDAKQSMLGYVAIHAHIHLAEILCQRAGDVPIAEIESLARKMLSYDKLTPGFVALSHGTLAIALLEGGNIEAAEIESRDAIQRSGNFPFRQLRMQSTLIRVLLAAKKITDARDIAIEALSKVESFGGAGYAEIPIRTAAAMAFHAANETQLAFEQLRHALREVDRQATNIPDLASQTRFRLEVADNARVAALASQWGLHA